MNTDKAAIKKIIERAAEIVDAGWCQHTHHKVVAGKDHYCIAGAMHAAIKESGFDRFEAEGCNKPIWDYLESSGLSPWMSTYNDAPERTKEEVVGLLREVAASLGDEA